MAGSYLFLLFVYCAIISISGATEKSWGSIKKTVPHVVTEEVWFDVLIPDYQDGEDYHGRFVIALFGEVVPMTALNFISLAKKAERPNRQSLHYKGTRIHRIVPDFVIQMGDVVNGDGTSGESIYGDKFVDENFELSHQAAGYVSMANTGPDSNSSQFFIILNKARWLNGKHVVFGKVIRGMEVVRTISNLEVKKGTATSIKKAIIEDCGVVGIPEKYELTPAEIKSNEDI